jgi:MFS superfamily sulfate permease-like transporter
MDPSDGVIPAAQREGITDRPPPRPARPNPEAWPGVTVSSGRLLLRRALVFVGLALVHAPVSLAALSLGRWLATLGADLPAGLTLGAFFFPLSLAPSEGILAGVTAAEVALNSLLWAATVYGFFLACRWTYRRLRRP